MECLRMAERAKGQEERAVLGDLARAWILLANSEEERAKAPKPSGEGRPEHRVG